MTTILAPLDEHECLALLAGRNLGRLGLSVGALPVILPVNYALDGRELVFRTDHGPVLDAALDHQVVCLEIDGFDGIAHEGWSVLATGMLQEIDDLARLARARALPIVPWGRPDAGHWVRLPVELLTGRRISHLDWSQVADARVDGARRPGPEGPKVP